MAGGLVEVESMLTHHFDLEVSTCEKASVMRIQGCTLLLMHSFDLQGGAGAFSMQAQYEDEAIKSIIHLTADSLAAARE